MKTKNRQENIQSIHMKISYYYHLYYLCGIVIYLYSLCYYVTVVT